MAKKPYLLTQARYNSLKNSGRLHNCQKCGKPFKPGDMIVSVTSRYKTKQYHLKCAKEVNLW